ncbi:MAG: hypothetical protein Q8K12_14870 [Thiobacillus sp.]|nr:hypothetical protein [Thiobacillus sp.]
MKFVEDNKRLLAKLGVGTIFVLVGVVVGVIGVLVIAVRNQPDPKELEEIRRQDVVEYIQTEQARLGIDCDGLKTTIQDFLEKDIRPVLNARQPGQDWNQDVSSNVRKRAGELRDYYFACGRLYSAARNGKWDGLKGLEFAVELDREIIILNTLIRFGEFGEQCDAMCLDQNFRELQGAFRKIEARLAEPESKRQSNES